ncbi:restriction endonuclease subunit S [Vibrio vulnificus]|nr:restriction endonuclease subunit S [Vibrio vulnificus]
MSWVECQLGDILTLKRGYDLPHSARKSGSVPVVSSSGITGYHNTAKVEGPAVVTGRYGTLGEVYYVEGECWPLNTSLYVQDFKGNRPKFVYYFLQSVLKGMQSDKAAVPGVNRNDLHARKVKCTKDHNVQVAVEKIISPYDDLIENNRRRIKLLEESARLLYQAWFVHLRFPGHEQVKIVDGLPEGWEKLTVAECCHKPTYGFTASASKAPIGPQFLRITDIVPTSINWAGVPYCDADEATAKKYQLKEGDIVVARTGATVGFAKRMPELNVPVVYASYLVKFSPNPSIIDDLLLGVFMESEQYKEFVRGNAGGAAQPNANAKVLGSAKLLIPTKLLQVEFRASIAPMIEQKFLLEKQNSALEKARDLLLPKLMSGELAV